ncbi:GRIP-related ARF-binding domain-containing protein 1 isoform 1 [Theobroma cacao]|uniref:GRIP-related ARF-binding domain-containing protein 1 isoform 1 n=1 Tax=Theobroma cacao TaxID=3641 RepID=A0A061DSS6_THECC|nr:GRIP-related ARF-binding domain-containing protein 1 isoform 1 [Theobroma cacao]
MWSSIANLKENLNKIALDVHDDDDEELEIYGSGNGDHSPFFDRRNSNRFAHSKPVSLSPVANGIDSPFNFEIERYRAEIKKLQESEAEIKALSVNYAALLKEKEEQISRLNQENGSLKQNLNVTNAALSAARSESSKVSSNGINALKGSSDQSPNRQHRSTSLVKNCYAGNQMSNGLSSKHDEKEKELADLLEEKNRSLEAVQASHESQIKQFNMELEKERDKLANVQIRLHEERKLNESFQEELKLLKSDKDKSVTELSKIRNELNEKIIEIRRLQMELNRRENDSADDTLENLRRVIATLEKENTHLKKEKNELEAALEISKKSLTGKIHPDAAETLDIDSSGCFPGKKEMELSLQKLEDDLKETCRERDKALQELTRLKQHLLEKESEESEKMDEDSKIIEELHESNEYQRAQIAHLEKALKLAMANQEEVKMMNNNEIQKSKEIIDDLNQKLANCMRTIDLKNVELLNLQTALGQYYAEIEAKEHLERDLALAREESAKLSGLLKDADERAELLKREKEEILVKLSQTERMLAEGKARVNKLEEDNGKLRRALEQSMTRLNRMSMDSDYLVDRRIVIKLLVTYFQRNHSKEVLDLMVRMLGFSDEDKQRIGVAQQGTGKGVVRGVLGLPGRLVGGILGGSSTDVHANMASDNQSIADLWVDFLLKETEEREKRESAEDASRSKENLHGRSPDATGTSPSVPNQRTTTAGSGFSRSSFSPSQNSGPVPPQGNFRQFEHSDSEFSTVPLTSSESSSRLSRLLPKY